MDWFLIKISNSLSKSFSVMSLSIESFSNQKISSFPHFLFLRFNVRIDATVIILSFLFAGDWMKGVWVSSGHPD